MSWTDDQDPVGPEANDWAPEAVEREPGEEDEVDWGDQPAREIRPATWARPEGAPIPAQLDPKQRPGNIACIECGEPIKWRWWDGITGRLAPRWTFPGNPCVGCADKLKTIDYRSRIRYRQALIGVIDLFEDHTLDRVERAADGMAALKDPAWIARVAQLRPPTIAVHPGNIEAWRALREFKPAERKSLWIYGETGTGKSMLITAFINRLIEQGEADPVFVPPSEESLARRGWNRERILEFLSRAPALQYPLCVKRMPTRIEASYTTEEELLEREKQSWKGDPAPLLKLVQTPLLLLDDAGVKTPKAAEFAKLAMARLYNYRYDRRLPSIVTSNVRPEDLHDYLGKRTASRMKALFPDVVHVRGHDVRGVR